MYSRLSSSTSEFTHLLALHRARFLTRFRWAAASLRPWRNSNRRTASGHIPTCSPSSATGALTFARSSLRSTTYTPQHTARERFARAPLLATTVQARSSQLHLLHSSRFRGFLPSFVLLEHNLGVHLGCRCFRPVLPSPPFCKQQTRPVSTAARNGAVRERMGVLIESHVRCRKCSEGQLKSTDLGCVPIFTASTESL